MRNAIFLISMALIALATSLWCCPLKVASILRISKVKKYMTNVTRYCYVNSMSKLKARLISKILGRILKKEAAR